MGHGEYLWVVGSREVGMAGVAASQGMPEGRGEVVLGDVYAEHADRLVGWFVRRTGDRVLAEDLAQDTFERFAEALDGFDGSRPVWPYLRAVAANVLIDHVRRADRQVVVPGEVVAAGLPEVALVDEQVVLGDLLGRGLEGLSVRQRVAVELQYERGWSVEEAAEFLGVSALSFRQLSWRARQRLRVWLEHVDDTLCGVVPVGVGVRARWRSWSARVRDVVAGPAPAMSMDTIATFMIAATLTVAGISVSPSEGAAPRWEAARSTTVEAPAPSDSVTAHREKAGSAAPAVDGPVAPEPALEQESAPEGRRTRVETEDLGETGVEGHVVMEETPERWTISHDVAVRVGDEVITVAEGDTVSVDCDFFVVGELLCSQADDTGPIS